MNRNHISVSLRRAGSRLFFHSAGVIQQSQVNTDIGFRSTFPRYPIVSDLVFLHAIVQLLVGSKHIGLSRRVNGVEEQETLTNLVIAKLTMRSSDFEMTDRIPFTERFV